jgi:hypothetical protein
MPTISALVAALSTEVVERLANLPTPIQLTDGQILMSRKHVYEQSSPPRIVMIPAKSRFSARDISSASNVAGYPSPEIRREWINRSIATDTVSFVCQCWGQATPAAPDDGDFDVTQALYQTVIASAHHLMVGRVEFTDGVWIDQKTDGTQLLVAGHLYEFGITVETPVLDIPGVYVPPGTTAEIMPFYQPPTGGPPVPP